MNLLLTGLVIFFTTHFVPVMGNTRQALVGAFGRLAYTALFSLLSLIGIVLIVYGYAEMQAERGDYPIFWIAPVWMKHIVFLLMLPSFVLLVAAYVPSRIRDAVRHPMLAAIKIWAFSHLLVNGDLTSIILFGSFLAYVVIDRISVKRRAAAGIEARGPLGARTGGLVGDITVIGVGLAAYAFMLIVGHQWLIGVALIN
ncbi:MAG: NnrU family protein [Pseudomonadota bacterium]